MSSGSYPYVIRHMMVSTEKLATVASQVGNIKTRNERSQHDEKPTPTLPFSQHKHKAHMLDRQSGEGRFAFALVVLVAFALVV